MATQKELEQQVAEFQTLQRQMQMILVQKQQIQLALEEIKIASEELGKTTSTVYKSAGALLLQTTKADAEKDLKERKETLEMRLGVLTKQEEKLRGRLTELKNKIDAAAKGGASAT